MRACKRLSKEPKAPRDCCLVVGSRSSGECQDGSPRSEKSSTPDSGPTSTTHRCSFPQRRQQTLGKENHGRSWNVLGIWLFQEVRDVDRRDGRKEVLNTAVQKQTEKSTQESVVGAALFSTAAAGRIAGGGIRNPSKPVFETNMPSWKKESTCLNIKHADGHFWKFHGLKGR